MRVKSIKERYTDLLEDLDFLNPRLIPLYASELARRHRGGWTLPKSTYSRCKDLLFYKESLERNSPYYVDLLKIEDRKKLKVILVDLCSTMRVFREVL